MGSSTEKARSYSWASVRVFWDVEDFPVPEGRDLCDFYDQVNRVLQIESYVTDLSIYAYTRDNALKGPFAMAEIQLACVRLEKRSRLNKMIIDMIAWAYQNAIARETIFILVAKDIPEVETDFDRVLKELAGRGYHIFLVVPDDFPLAEAPSDEIIELIWRWTELFDGKFPIEDFGEDSENDDDCPHEKRPRIDAPGGGSS
ncbi:uncharacterized protein LOC17899282 [Capsella rubella]|nr:uncharacterized protein LOC17899282 [Capsella rubella]